MKLLLIISIILLIQLISFAHEGKHVKKAVMQDTVTIVGGDTIAINGIYKNLVKKIVDPDTLKEKPMKLNPSEQVFEHLHNKLVHFPIALGVFAFLLTLINFKWKNFDSAILISILIALLFAIGAFITGKNQSEPFIDTAKEWVVELHQAFGLSVLLSFFVWSV